MLNKHTIKTAANAREKREPQSVPVNISPFAARWRCFRTHTHTHLQRRSARGERRTQKLIQWCSQELFTYATRAKLLRTPKKTRLTLFRARYPGKYLASASLSYSKSLVWSKTTQMAREWEERGNGKGGQVLPLEKLLAPDGPLDCLLGLWYEEREWERGREGVRAWVCVCVCDVCVAMCGPSRQLW